MGEFCAKIDDDFDPSVFNCGNEERHRIVNDETQKEILRQEIYWRTK
jgi:hypothetical protein